MRCSHDDILPMLQQNNYSLGVPYTASPCICIALVAGFLVIFMKKRKENESMNLGGIYDSYGLG